MFAAGCFWGVEENFRKLKGVFNTSVGYTGGTIDNPSYEVVCGGKSGHAESILIEYDPKIIEYRDLVRFFFGIHDPTTKDRQGFDFGSQYRSSIFYFNNEQKKIAEDEKKMLMETKPVVTDIIPSDIFYPAEDYHQQYIQKRNGLL